MTIKPSVLAVITARGGSKGLPGKNIRPLLGKPLIEWTIEAARKSSHINRIICSTDDPKIAEVARSSGAEVPFMRPAELASDTATSVDVLIHALDHLAAEGETYEMVVLLEPTSPQREATDIDTAITRLRETGAGAIVGVTRAVDVHPQFMYTQDTDGRLKPYLKEQQRSGLRRQELDPVYYLEGTVYVSRVDELRQKRSFYHDDTLAYETPRWKSLEIDDLDDFIMVQALMQHYLSAPAHHTD